MRRNNFLKCFWFTLVLLVVANTFAATPDQALQTLLSSPSLDKNQTAVYIWDLNADRQVVAYRPDAPVTPASVMKAVSTAALQSVLPYNHKFKTNVYTEGNVDGGVLNGNIILIGGGDPSLGDGRHKGQPDFIAAIVEKLKSRGINAIEGEIKLDDSLFAGPATHPSWGAGDLNQYYGTGVHAFNFEGNASGGKAIKNPAGVFKRKLLDAFKAQGIRYTEIPKTLKSKNRKLLLSYESPQLHQLMTSCMFRSDNLYAEAFLRLFGVEKGTNGSVDSSAKEAMRYWELKHYPMTGVEIVDGSGLSRKNRLTARFLGTVLKNLKNDPIYASFFPLVGEEGTVKSFMKGTPLQGYMALKTGSMNGIQSYAGYVVDEDFEPTHVVVIMTNGLKNRDAFRQALSKFFMTLFN